MLESNADRNLLIGILALQMDFISREQLITATNVWMNKKSRPLDDILVEQRALASDTHPLLVALVEKHLALHGGDARQSLGAVSSLGSLRDQLQRLGDAELDASIGHVAVEPTDDDPHATVVPAGNGSRPRESRFRVLRPHARGGLGEVLVAQDAELNREVALKQILVHHADNSESRARFVLEAEVTGGLEHPGIVPVYGLGHYSDGRPYYAMRFIRGDSLNEAIDRFHGRQDNSVSPTLSLSYASVEFRKLLGRFVDVCEAIQYAHSRGVLHRDLKPGNIMLGKHGETLVVDWGLAKLQGRADATTLDDEATLHPKSGSGTAPSELGSTIGTPGYMPPEQAAGRIDEMGPASDVYSLGATLYHLLTGQAPVSDPDLGKLLRRVENGEFPTPRSVQPQIPRSLEAICLRAMATRPANRYASPQALADEVECFLADEPVQACVDPLTVKAARWIRKHQTLTVAGIAAVLVGGLSLFALVVSGKNTQLAASNLQEFQARQDAEQSAQDATDARQLAEKNATTAREQTQLTLDALNTMIFDIQQSLEDVAGASQARRQLLSTALQRLQQIADEFGSEARIDRQRMFALVGMGDVFLQVGAGEANLQAETGAADPETADTTSPLESAANLYQQALEIAEQLLAEDPQDRQARRDLGLLCEKRGDVRLRQGLLSEATEDYERGREIAEVLVSQDSTDADARERLWWAYGNLGEASFESGQLPRAIEHLGEAVLVAESLAKDQPDDVEAQRRLLLTYGGLGELFVENGNFSNATDHYQRGLKIAEQLLAADPINDQAQEDLAFLQAGLRQMEPDRGMAQSAAFVSPLERARDQLGVSRRLAQANPLDFRVQGDLAAAYDQLAEEQQVGMPSEAVRSYEQALEIRKHLAQRDLSDIFFQRDLLDSYHRLGDAIIVMTNRNAKMTNRNAREAAARAKECHQNGLAIAERMAKNYPESAFQRALIRSYQELAYACSGQQDAGAEALGYYQQGLQVAQQLATAAPDNGAAQNDLYLSHYYLAEMLQHVEQWSEAADQFRHASAVLVAMKERNQFVEQFERRQSDTDQQAERAARTSVAMGDWDALLAQPAEQLPGLVAERGLRFAREAQIEAAAQAAAKLQELAGVDDVSHYNAARVFSLCAAAIRADVGEALTAADQQRREAFIGSALEALQSISASWDDWDRVQQDSDLAAIRDLPEFQKLLPESN